LAGVRDALAAVPASLFQYSMGLLTTDDPKITPFLNTVDTFLLDFLSATL